MSDEGKALEWGDRRRLGDLFEALGDALGEFERLEFGQQVIFWRDMMELRDVLNDIFGNMGRRAAEEGRA